MIPERFEREMLRCLREHRARYPHMQAQDEVKFVFQAMLGAGHLLAPPETVEERIHLETADLQPDPEEPLPVRLHWPVLILRFCWYRIVLTAVAPVSQRTLGIR